MTRNDQLEPMRHSLAHIMATAIKQIWPGAKFGVGPVVEDGFYYDVDLGKVTLSEDDLSKIEKKMKSIIKDNQAFQRFELSIEDAMDWAKKEKQTYKLELLKDLKREGTTVASEIDKKELGLDTNSKSKVETVSFYKNGDFIDLCRGPHVKSTKDVGAFKLVRVSGAYWRGNENNPQLQRIYGVAFSTEKELSDYLEAIEEAKARDHRKLGQELGLFFFHETAPGMPYWLPNGVRLYNELISFWRDEHSARGYQEIVSPLLNKKELYITSGHYSHFWDDMFTSKTKEGEEYGMKPMNCPNAMIVFKHQGRSYRDLPLRLSDTDVLHRYELSGTLNGLFRVREFRQDDAHIFVREDQIKEEYLKILEIVERFYSIFDLKYSFRLGTRPDKFMGEVKTWDKAEAALKDILKSSGQDYYIEEGDGAFYGPKIDILMRDSLNRPWQMGTIQLDFQQPRNFQLSFTDSDGQEKTPVAIHRVIYGSLERFIGILIEHLAGRFPVWLAPIQIRLITVNQEEGTLRFAETIVKQAEKNGLRIEVDNSNESVGKKIRSAELSKVPFSVVLGEKEMANNVLTPRVRGDLKLHIVDSMSIEDFIAVVKKLTKSRK